jgi:hypothetical protein
MIPKYWPIRETSSDLGFFFPTRNFTKYISRVVAGTVGGTGSYVACVDDDATVTGPIKRDVLY